MDDGVSELDNNNTSAKKSFSWSKILLRWLFSTLDVFQTKKIHEVCQDVTSCFNQVNSHDAICPAVNYLTHHYMNMVWPILFRVILFVRRHLRIVLEGHKNLLYFFINPPKLRGNPSRITGWVAQTRFYTTKTKIQ